MASPTPSRMKLSLSTKLVALFMSVISVSFGGLSAWYLDRNGDEHTEALRKRSELTARALAKAIGPALDRGETARAFERLTYRCDADPEIAYVALVDGHGRVVASTEPTLGSRTLANDGPISREFEGTDLEPTFEITVPVVTEGQQLGHLHVGVSDAALRSHLEASALVTLQFGVAAILVSLLIILPMLRRLVVAPVRRLQDAAIRISEGDLDVRINGLADDELGQLGAAFNTMATNLERSRDQLRAASVRDAEASQRRMAEEALQRASSSRAAEMAEAYRRLDANHNELSALQAKLIESSRMAGMAQVASSMLHNVGNVLNSLNISVEMSIARLTESRLEGLKRAVALLTEPREDLHGYLTDDPRGKHLIPYLAKVCEALDEDSRELLVEARKEREHLEHIKTIIVGQQALARAGSVVEDRPVGELLDQALDLLRGSLTANRISLVRLGDEALSVSVDRHRVLQILVNLLTNAVHATVSKPEWSSREVRVQVDRLDAETFVVSVTDDGVGIPAAHLTAVFSHGFTTKEDGNGFGLHDASLAARSMGGELTCESDGEGRGAKFALKLPIDGSKQGTSTRRTQGSGDPIFGVGPKDNDHGDPRALLH